MSNSYNKEEVWGGDVKFHITYWKNFERYWRDTTILVESQYVDRMEEMLQDLGFEFVGGKE